MSNRTTIPNKAATVGNEQRYIIMWSKFTIFFHYMFDNKCRPENCKESCIWKSSENQLSQNNLRLVLLQKIELFHTYFILYPIHMLIIL